MAKDVRRHQFDVVRGHVIAPAEQSVGSGETLQRNRASGAGAQFDLTVVSGRGNEADNIGSHQVGDRDFFRVFDQTDDILLGGDVRDLLLGFFDTEYDAYFVFISRIADGNLDHETVNLCFRQFVSAQLIDGVLRRKDHERPFHLISIRVDGDLLFFHDLQHSGLGLGGSTVDLIRQDDVTHRRAVTELEFAGFLIVNRETGNIGRHDVRSELDPFESAIDGLRQSGDQTGFTGTGHVFDKNVPFRDHRQDDDLNDIAFTDDDRLDVVDDL